jgi:hypothetical protein
VNWLAVEDLQPLPPLDSNGPDGNPMRDLFKFD